MLKISKDMLRYINEFPFEQYDIAQIRCFNREMFFYVDSINDCIKGCLAKGMKWEGHVYNWIAKHALPGTKVIDVGAHIGTHTLTMAYCVGDKGHVYAFEPQPKIFRELFQNIRLNLLKNISCIWAAAGAKQGTIEASPFVSDNEGATPLMGGAGIHVDLIPIDSLKLNKVSLIKIDVEGMENLVLEGAKETILRNKPVILVEIMGGYLPETAPASIVERIDHTKRQVASLGYDVKRIGNWDYLALKI
jgi:FkbM family methyltransferase